MIGKILLKTLSIFYFAMAIIGFLGYFEIESHAIQYFSLFPNLLGEYAILIPIICVIFTGICWKLAKIVGEQNEQQKPAHNQSQIISQNKTNSERRYNPERKIPRHAALNSRKYSDNGFASYFSGDLLITEDNGPIVDRFNHIGTNFSTYFGEGRNNIYLPAKAVNLQGFKDYFRARSPFVKEYDQVVNDTMRMGNSRESYSSSLPKKQLFPSFTNQYRETKIESKIEQPLRSLENIEISQEKEKKLSTKENQLKENGMTIGWKLPSLDLLHFKEPSDTRKEQQNPKLLEETLSTFGVTAKVTNISTGPVTTRYELTLAPGTKISKIVNLADDIALALASRDIRIEAPIPGKAAVGIEIPRKYPQTVYFKDVIDSEQFRNKKDGLKVVLGKDIANNAVVGELERMPHLLVAGATGSGKSIFINCLINSFLYTATPDDVRLLMIDPKMVELNVYNGIPHLLSPVVTDPKKANQYLQFIVKEMENRYELFAASGVRDIDHYNKTIDNTFDHKKLPYIVVIIDELSDLMMVASNEIEESICRLAQMARAAGIHLVIATQRPSVNVITGIIKANIPSRISFAVSSQIDSRTILDTGGAEKLLGKGDMLYSPIGLNKPQRVHGSFIDEQEVKRVIAHWKAQGSLDYEINEEQLEETFAVQMKEEELDEKFMEAGELIITTGVASVSFLQRRLRVGYSRAARLMDMLEEAGVVGRSEGTKPREILMSIETYNERYCS